MSRVSLKGKVNDRIVGEIVIVRKVRFHFFLAIEYIAIVV